MSILTSKISDVQVEKVLALTEGQFGDLKGKAILPSALTKTISAFANSDGGDLYIGIDESTNANGKKIRTWDGFVDIEAANAHLQVFENLFPLGSDYQYEFLASDSKPGLVLHVLVNKIRDIVKASNGIPYLRRGAQNLPQDTPDKLKKLEYTKGVTSFENEVLRDAPLEAITESETVEGFISEVVPTTSPEKWLKKQLLIREGAPTVTGALLFADEPQVLLPKRSGVKVYRYKTSDKEGFRDVLAFTPKTVEGCIYSQIKKTVELTVELVEDIPRLGDTSLEAIRYPQETLHEIITNAVIHRDYSIPDDVHIRIFDNRIEIQSPGGLPGHMTVVNILEERYARNGSVVRILNKFPNPPNQDVGEGLNTAFRAMHSLGLKSPVIEEKDNSVLVTVKHEMLASAEEVIMDYLEKHPSINNSTARDICHIPRDYRIKIIFGRMVQSCLIEQVPGTKTSSTSYRKKA